MQFFFSLAIFAIIFVVCSYVLFYADSRRYPWIRSLQVFLFDTFPDMLRKTIRKIFGETVAVNIEKALLYVFCQSNPFIQVFYVMLAGGGFYIYWTVGFKLFFPGLYLSTIHIYTGTAIMMICYASFLLASFTDPGTITSSNYKDYIRKYPYDGIIFEPKKECTTCKFDKPARSKHCSLCKRCIGKMDHHCIWINNCVRLTDSCGCSLGIMIFDGFFFLVFFSPLCRLEKETIVGL